MSGETEKQVSGWTVDTLKAFHDQAIRHERELRETEKHATDLALQLQRAENDRHFTALNGEQGRIANVLAATIPREVFDAYKEGREKADRLVADQLSEQKGASAQTTRWITIALFAIAVVTLLLKFIPTQAVGS